MQTKFMLAGLLLLVCAACGPNGPFVPVTTRTPLQPLATPSLPPTPTETLLPTPEPATPTVSRPGVEAWTGQPTYSESLPGYLFRLEYDPQRWWRSEDAQGYPALVHRLIASCTIALTAGRGLPPSWMVEDTFRLVGNINFEVVTASKSGVIQFVNYFGGDNNIVTGFQVSFEAQMDECLGEAEAVLATLTSMPAPAPTPTP